MFRNDCVHKAQRCETGSDFSSLDVCVLRGHQDDVSNLVNERCVVVKMIKKVSTSSLSLLYTRFLSCFISTSLLPFVAVVSGLIQKGVSTRNTPASRVCAIPLQRRVALCGEDLLVVFH